MICCFNKSLLSRPLASWPLARAARPQPARGFAAPARFARGQATPLQCSKSIRLLTFDAFRLSAVSTATQIFQQTTEKLPHPTILGLATLALVRMLAHPFSGTRSQILSALCPLLAYQSLFGKATNTPTHTLLMMIITMNMINIVSVGVKKRCQAAAIAAACIIYRLPLS